MKAYIAISFSKRKILDSVIQTIENSLKEFQIQSFVFVNQYEFGPEQEKEMMQQAVQDLNSCDLLIAETSEKGIGIGIEVGYAKALGKPIFYMRQLEAAHSTTVSGISDYQIVYKDFFDLSLQLRDKLTLFMSTK